MTSSANERSKTGFTLVELLATIAIMAVLAALVMPVVQKAQDSAGQAGNASNLRALAAASMAYASDHNGWLPEATYFGNHIPQRMWPLVSLLQGKYVDQSSLSSPLALPVASAGGGSNQVPVMVSGYTSAGDLTISWKADIKTSPKTVAYEAWANTSGWSTRGGRQRLGLPPQDYSGQPETTPPSKMKILWNYQYDIPVNKGVVAIAFGDGHVESRSIKAPKIFDDVMAEE
jgi:prepilin-type N-terminal cleavage/methylation domain-containing protein/prepilin-type processing-associated H-X9-DG protein